MCIGSVTCAAMILHEHCSEMPQWMNAIVGNGGSSNTTCHSTCATASLVGPQICWWCRCCSEHIHNPKAVQCGLCCKWLDHSHNAMSNHPKHHRNNCIPSCWSSLQAHGTPQTCNVCVYNIIDEYDIWNWIHNNTHIMLIKRCTAEVTYSQNTNHHHLLAVASWLQLN